MKYKIILVVGLLIISLIVAIVIKRTTFYSNSGQTTIADKDFNLECRIADDGQELDISFVSQNNLSNKVEELRLLQLQILPIVNQKDTLKNIVQRGNGNRFHLAPKKVERLDLVVKYQVDSAGFIIKKSKKYYNLEKVYTYTIKSIFHY